MGLPLTLDRAANDDLALSWGSSCAVTDSDYAIYEGTLGDFASHEAKSCSTSGNTNTTLTPAAGSRYYVIVPTDGSVEGSYGVDSTGSARPAATIACAIPLRRSASKIGARKARNADSAGRAWTHPHHNGTRSV